MIPPAFPRILRGATAIVLAAGVIVVGSVLSMLFLPIARLGFYIWLAPFLVFAGPNWFKPSIEPQSAGAWTAVGWVIIALGYGICTRGVARRGRVLAWAFVTVAVWLLPQTMLAKSYIAHDWRRGSEEAMHRKVLSETPLGSSMDQVEEVIRREEWRVVRVDYERGFLDQRPSREPTYKVTGEKHIQANVGDFQGFPFQANVQVFWAFDQSGTLIDMWVWRTVNSL